MMAEKFKKVLSLLDFIALDEDIVDVRLKSVYQKKNLTSTELENVLTLLLYKKFLYDQECGGGGDLGEHHKEPNEIEDDNGLKFLTSLINIASAENVDVTCEILKTMLTLSSSSRFECEHFVQQIIPNIESLLDENDEQIDNTDAMIQQLKVCESIYNVISVIPKHLAFSNNFLMNPQILFHAVCEKLFVSEKYQKVRSHFLISTLKSIIMTENGYQIIDLIWDEIVKLSAINTAAVLKGFCDMSEHFLLNGNRNYKTMLLESCLFWESIVFGLTSLDIINYKMAIYLAKRGIDSRKQPLIIKNDYENVLVAYDNSMASKWADFFVLLESLEESQSNIVLPSLQLFDSVNKINCTVTNTAYYLGLHHENYDVRTKCIHNLINEQLATSNDQENRNVLNRSTLKWLMEALNDVNRFEQCKDTYTLMQMMYKVFEHDSELFFLFYTLIPEIDWSPIPLYHIMMILKCQIEVTEENPKENRKVLPPGFDSEVIFKTTCEIIQMKCNSVTIRDMKCRTINLMIRETNIHSILTWKQKLIIFDLMQKSTAQMLNYHWMFQNLGDNDVDDILTDIMTPNKSKLCYNFINFNKEKDPSKITLLKKRLVTTLDSLDSMCDRQYAITGDSITDFVFVSNFYVICYAYKYTLDEGIEIFTILLKYLRKLLVKEKLNLIEVDMINGNQMLLFDKVHFKYCQFFQKHDGNYNELLKNVFKIAIYFLPHEQCSEKKLLIINIINLAFNYASFIGNKSNYSEDMNNFLELILDIKFDDTSKGKLRNKFYEISCQIILLLFREDKNVYDISSTMNLIEFIIDKGGYSCLQYVLEILFILLPSVVNKTEYNLAVILKKIWTDIQELKQSSLFIPTIKSFIDLITEPELLTSEYKDDAAEYYQEIIKFGQESTRPLHFLASSMKKVIAVANSSNDDVLCSIIVDVMLFSRIPKKDQRILRNLSNSNFYKAMYNVALGYFNTLGHFDNGNEEDCFDVEIQSIVRHHISEMPELSTNLFTSINEHIMEKVDLVISNKKRYHFNSNVHRTLLAALKSLLLVKLFCSDINNDRDVAIWCVGMLNKLPHQNSVRIALEWHISFYLTTLKINKDELDSLNFWTIPIISQLNILYLLTHDGNNTEFVLDNILSHTMGSNFNIRLQAQYLSYKIYDKSTHLEKYDEIMKIIRQTLDQSVSEKNYIKINDDFANDFHMKYPENLFFIEFLLPRYYDGYNGELYLYGYNIYPDSRIVKYLLKFDEWKYLSLNTNRPDGNWNLKFDVVKSSEDRNDIQKKYMPWNSMTGIDVIDQNKKNTKHGELILVASLIDKLPNLGGMARTSEVFGIKTYVVANKASTEDKQFKGLSVSAEQWIDIEQVAPGPELIEYLRLKKSEGYTLIAAEQTRNSVMLDAYTFPKKSLLLLGHEKTGVPYNILPLMDVCVEIPQQGVVRSLNVHVTAAIFVWEYTRQHINQ